MQKTYSIPVTYACNWTCPYCIVDTHNRTIDFADVMQKVSSVEPGSNVYLTGGEPGMLKRAQLMEVVNALRSKQCDINVVTNGLLLRHTDLISSFKTITYHCSMNLDLADEITKIEHDAVQYLVVITDQNYDKLDAFLEKHSDIKFMLSPGELVTVNGNPGNAITRRNVTSLLRKYQAYLQPGNIDILRNFLLTNKIQSTDVDTIAL